VFDQLICIPQKKVPQQKASDTKNGSNMRRSQKEDFKE